MINWVAEGLTAASAAAGLVTKIFDKLKSPKPSIEDLRNNVGELVEHIVNTRLALSALIDENNDLRSKLDNREALKAIDSDLDWDDGNSFRLRKSDVAKGRFLPYCPQCWAHDDKLIPLNPVRSDGYYTCPYHPDGNYQTTKAKETRRGR